MFGRKSREIDCLVCKLRDAKAESRHYQLLVRRYESRLKELEDVVSQIQGTRYRMERSGEEMGVVGTWRGEYDIYLSRRSPARKAFG